VHVAYEDKHVSRRKDLVIPSMMSVIRILRHF